MVRIEASARDCTGNLLSTASGGADSTEVIDALAPDVTSSVAVPLLWPPEHDVRDVGFARGAADNCDAQVAGTLATAVWAD